MAARLQNEIAPKNAKIDTENGLKTIRNVSEKCYSPLTTRKSSHRHFSKSFSPPKIWTQKKE